MIRIVHFIDTLFQGGAETLVKDYARFLDKKKFNLTVLCLRRTESPYERIIESLNVNVIYICDYFGSCKTICGRVKNKLAKTFGLYHLKIKKVLFDLQPDVVHAHLAVLRYLKYADLNSTKFFYTVHSEPLRYWHCSTSISKKEFKASCWLIKEKKLQLIALHNSMRVELNRLFGVDNTIVINNGIDFSKFSNVLTKEKSRKKLKIPKDAFVVGHLGRFIQEKNHVFLLKIFARLVEKKSNSLLLLIGSGPLLDSIKSKINELRIENNVLILSNRTDVPDLLNAMDVFAFPSIYEGLGIALIEAQKMGLPCVVSDKVPSAATISNLVTTLQLTAAEEKWVDALLKPKPKIVEYQNLESWDIRNVVKQLEILYQKKAED